MSHPSESAKPLAAPQAPPLRLLIQEHRRALRYLNLAAHAFEGGMGALYERCLDQTQRALLLLPALAAEEVEEQLASDLGKLYHLCVLRICRAKSFRRIDDVELVRLVIGRLLRGWRQTLTGSEYEVPPSTHPFLLESPLSMAN